MCERWQLYAFLALPILSLLIFNYGPMGGVLLAFKDYDFTKGILGSPWIGLENFRRFFDSYMFGRIIKNTLIISFYGLIAGFPMPILLALFLNAIPLKRYRRVVQTITYLPHFISTVVMVGILMQLLNPRIGIWGMFGRFLRLDTIPDLMGNSAAFRHIYVWSGVWQGTGFASIIYFAALSGVDPELHEAAIIDGATHWKRILHIDIPAILPTITMLLILNAGGIMNVGWEKIYLMQNDINLKVSEVISTYVYNVGLASGSGDFSYSTAIGLFNSVINLALLILVNSICNKINDSGIF